jgi:hypothetical protein
VRIPRLSREASPSGEARHFERASAIVALAALTTWSAASLLYAVLRWWNRWVDPIGELSPFARPRSLWAAHVDLWAFAVAEIAKGIAEASLAVLVALLLRRASKRFEARTLADQGV